MKQSGRFPFFLFLLPVFFVLHGFLENYNPGLLRDALELALIYLAIATILGLLFYFLFRNKRKAALASFTLLALHLFFGSTHDFLKKLLNDFFLTRYTFLVPSILILFFAFLVYLKRTKKNFIILTQYLNLLLILLILIDATLLSVHSRKRFVSMETSLVLTPCADCPKPDIHLIVADEYAGRKELQDIFSFDNTAFESALKQRGFHITGDSRANYNATVYSMGSMLNMDYIRYLESTTVNHPDMLYCRELINRNNGIEFLERSGYRFFNHSYFEFAGIPNPFHNFYYPTKKELITAQTFTGRFRHDLGYNFASKKELKEFTRHNLYNNIATEKRTRELVTKRSNAPRFVYTHFSMPHHPYYFDSNGKEARYDEGRSNYVQDRNSYIQYLVYANKKLIDLVDHIRQSSSTPPIIILISDHGFRQFDQPVDQQYYFMNLNAVYLPNGDYSGFYEGMTLVNQFRIILNSAFRQKLPMIRDSTIFLLE